MNRKFGLLHTCPAGCCGDLEKGPCANKTKSIQRAQDLAAKIFMPPISEPAANKYTKVDPCVRSVVLITWCFGLLRKALGEKLRKEDTTGQADAEAYVVDTDGAIGIPRDTMEYERKMGHIRLQKVHTFFCHGISKYLGLVWLVVAAPIMVVHYHLFRHGKF